MFLEQTQSNQIKTLSKTQKKKLLKVYQKRITALQNEHYRKPMESDNLIDKKYSGKTLGESLGYRLSTSALVRESISKRDSDKQQGVRKLHARIAKKSLHEYTKPRYSVISKFKAVSTVYDLCTKTPKGYKG